MKRALTIAGSDSGGGAGVQGDLKTFSAFGVYGATAITAVTVQNTRTVEAIHPIPPAIVEAQIDAVLSDIGADAVKTGMLFSADTVTAVARALTRHRPDHVVADPVMISKSGSVLLESEAVEALVKNLFPLCEVLTPNLPEAEALLGRPVRNRDDMRAAARELLQLGPRSVLLKGGHLEGELLDVLYDGHDWHEFESSRIDSKHTHGTGCTLSSALAASLALGLELPEAVEVARDYVFAAIRTAPALGEGFGPLNHGTRPRLPGAE